MRSLQLALDGELAKLAEAEKENYKYGYDDLQAEVQETGRRSRGCTSGD